MKKRFRQTRVFTFLILLVIGISCKGQVEKDLAKEKVNESSLTSDKQLERIQTQSLNKGDNVHCSLQDKAGNLWFGTTGDGIYKYDGKVFTQFTAADGLDVNTVWCILEDRSGEIWVGTADGVYLYDDNRFSKIQVAQPNDTLKSKYDVWSIMQDKSGKLWFATGVGVFVYDSKSFTSFKLGSETQNECKFNVETVLEDKAGNFWFGGRCNPGVYRYDGKTIIHLKPNGDDWAWPVLQDKKGDIWFSSWNGAYQYDGKSFSVFTKNDGLSGDMVARIMEDKKGNLWFGGDGLSRYDGKTFTHFTAKDGLSNTSIWSILEDNTGNFWIGTRATGLFLYDGIRFIKFSE